jgi:hypothetical protein
MKAISPLYNINTQPKQHQGTINFLNPVAAIKHTPEEGNKLYLELLHPLYESLGHPNPSTLFKSGDFFKSKENGHIKVFDHHLLIPNQGTGDLEAKMDVLTSNKPRILAFRNISLINNKTFENDVPSEHELLQRLKQNIPLINAVIQKVEHTTSKIDPYVQDFLKRLDNDDGKG